MRPRSILSRRTARGFTPPALLAALACVLLAAASRPAAAQCFLNRAGEAAVGVRNASSHNLLFYLDGMPMDRVPAGARSIDFAVAPGEHALRAEAVVEGETVSATRTAFILEGHVCTWTVTDPQSQSGGSPHELRDGLRREPPGDFVGWRGRRL